MARSSRRAVHCQVEQIDIPLVDAARAARPAPRRRSRPAFESLEPRTVPSATPTTSIAAALASVTTARDNQAYVDGLIGTGLDGSAPQAAMARKLTAELDRGVPREKVVLQLLESTASRRVQVDATYEGLLGRAPTRAQLRRGLALVGQAGDTRPLEGAIIGSREFLEVRGGGTPTGFLTAMYRAVLGRAPSSSELASGRMALAGGASRVELASALMRTKPARTLLIERVQAEFGVPIKATARDYRLLSRPGGLVRTMARVEASQASYRLMLSPLASPPEPTTSAPSVPGYPVAPGFDLTSSEQPLGLSSFYVGNSVFSIGAGTDDVPWIGTHGGLSTYSLNTGALTTMASTPAPVISIAAIDANEAYAVYGGAGGSNSIIHVVQGAATTLPAMPNGDYPIQVSASPDGTVWALAESGHLESYATTGTWSPISTDGYAITEIAVGSASNIWALTTSGVGLKYSAASGFQPDSYLTGGYSAIQATSDGSVWAYGDGYLFMKPSYGVWKLAPTAAQPPTGLSLVGFAAGSMNRALAFGALTSNSQLVYQIDLLQIGVVDRQPIPFPTFTGDAETAYLDLSASETNNPLGVRSLYDTPGLDWGTIENAVDNTKEPTGFPDNVWQAVKAQLDTEFNDLATVYGRIDEIETINSEIQLINDGQLSAVGKAEGLIVNNNDSNTTIRLVLEDLFEAVAGSISDIGLSPAWSTLASLLASGFSDGISYFESMNNDSPNQQLAIAFSDLQGDLDSIFKQSIEGLNTDLAAVAGDYGELTTVAGAILNGQWPLTNPDVNQIINTVTTTYTDYFYQTLTAAQWQVVYLLNCNC
jgi:hypothetical protein